ncbi:hypothetical protein Bca101_056415 [Brassica carinata]
MKATAEYATANIAVWWDMKDCPIPEGYEAGRVRSSLEAAFKEQGYSGPVSITAYGDQTQTPDHILTGLLSTCWCSGNYKATPEFATAKIQVWWDLFDCPIPEGYDARQVRPSIEAAVKELGYSGPVSIAAYGDHKHTPLQTLSSTGVDIAHTMSHTRECIAICWNGIVIILLKQLAIIMLISDNVEIMACGLVELLQENNYNFFLAYSFKPYKMSYLLTSAEWLWESVLAGPLTSTSGKEDYFFKSAAAKVEAVNLPQCFIADCVSALIPKALIISGLIFQVMKNMHKKTRGYVD